MNLLFLRPRNERGFTLIEMMAAIGLFSMFAVGLVPVFLSSMRGTNLTRSYTVGKNLAQEAIERARGLPYWVSYNSQNRKVDLLDLYFPDMQAPGYSGGTYTTTCTSGSADPACPKPLPAGYTVTFATDFVRPVVGGATEQFETVVPTDYRWDSTLGLDHPSANLLRLKVTTTWNLGARPGSFSLLTVIGDRKFEALKVAGGARIDYGVQVLTQFVDPTGRKSALTARDGIAESKIESRLVSSATQTVDAGLLRVTEVPDEEGVVAETIASAQGAKVGLNAPPNSTPGTITAPAVLVENTQLLPPPAVAGAPATTPRAVAGADITVVKNPPASVGGVTVGGVLGVGITAELPNARGAFGYSAENLGDDFWASNQLDTLTAAALRLDSTKKLMRISPNNSSGFTIEGATLAETAPVNSGRKVRTLAAYTLRSLRLLPVEFITQPGNQATSVVVVDTFTSIVQCSATATDSTAIASATWTATVRYWTVASGFVSVTLTESNAATTLANLRAGNPLVYDDILNARDLYLFDDPDLGRKGYLVNWSAGDVQSSKTEGGRVTSASIDGAMRIDTVSTNPSIEGSTINLSLGQMKCEAVDRR